MNKKLVLLNDLFPELDQDLNGFFYEKETENTGVVYRIENILNGKSYIGRANSYEASGRKHGATGRFREHWSSRKNIYNKKSRKICPVFYEALNNSELCDWFVFTIKVCLKENLKEWETYLIKEYKTSDPEFGYNVFVGNNKPDNVEHLKKYQSAKALSNAKRATDGKLKRTDINKALPTYVSHYPVRKNGVIVREGYMGRIKIGNTLYKKIFTSEKDTMETRLEKAIEYIKLIQSGETNKITKGARSLDQSKGLPKNIRYCSTKKDGKITSEGYCVEICINKKRYKKLFASRNETMEDKLEKAKNHLKILKKEPTKKYYGSKTNKK